MKNLDKVDEFKDEVLKKFRSATIDIDASQQKNGSIWINIDYKRKLIIIEFRSVEGFGFYADDAEFGEGPETIKTDVVSAVKLAVSKLSVKKKKKKKKK